MPISAAGSNPKTTMFRILTLPQQRLTCYRLSSWITGAYKPATMSHHWRQGRHQGDHRDVNIINQPARFNLTFCTRVGWWDQKLLAPSPGCRRSIVGSYFLDDGESEWNSLSPAQHQSYRCQTSTRGHEYTTSSAGIPRDPFLSPLSLFFRSVSFPARHTLGLTCLSITCKCSTSVQMKLQGDDQQHLQTKGYLEQLNTNADLWLKDTFVTVDPRGLAGARVVLYKGWGALQIIGQQTDESK